MNHYSTMSNFSKVRHELGDDMWTYLLNSSIGVFAKFADLSFTLAAERAHYFLVNQLLVDDAYEIWSLIDDQPLCFSLHEYAAFTGLNSDPIKTSEVCTLSHEEFWMEMGISTETWPTYEELVKVIVRSHLIWESGRRTLNFDQFITEEKVQHGKVRMKHMIDLPASDIFPVWRKGDKIDPLLLNLIEDIMSGNLRANAWSEDESKKIQKVLADVAETSTKKRR